MLSMGRKSRFVQTTSALRLRTDIGRISAMSEKCHNRTYPVKHESGHLVASYIPVTCGKGFTRGTPQAAAPHNTWLNPLVGAVERLP
jgi:hypothetical protein